MSTRARLCVVPWSASFSHSLLGFRLNSVDLGVFSKTNHFEALTFGAMISATDPVASLSVLSSMGQLKDKDLSSLIFGEAVLNDAVAVVLFTGELSYSCRPWALCVVPFTASLHAS